MAGEIQLNSTTALTEDTGAITLNNVNSATNRTNLGLGSIATQASGSIDIDGGAIDGVTIGTNSAATDVRVDNLKLDGNTISSTNIDGNIVLDPNGTGNVLIGNFTLDADQTVGAGQDNMVLTYDYAQGTIGLEAAASSGTIASQDSDAVAITGGSITGTEFDLKSSGTSIYKSDGTTAVISESGGTVTLSNIVISSGTSVIGQLGGGYCVQVQTKLYDIQDSTTSTIPFDDTKPQSTEGKEFFSIKITPSNSSNFLLFQATVFCSSNSTGQIQTLALFKDSEADARAVSSDSQSDGTHMTMIPIMYGMTAGTTSEITFKIRGGNHSTGTFYVNGNGSNAYSTAATSTLTVSEFSAIS